MRIVAVRTCAVCGGSGALLHVGVPDRLLGTAGTWSIRRCATCGGCWLDPRPIDDDLHLAYPGYYTHGSSFASSAGASSLHEAELGEARRRFGAADGTTAGSREGHWLLRYVARASAGRRADAAHLAAHLRVEPGAPLLDVGSGDGRLVWHLTQLGWRAEGVEPDEEAAAAARARGIEVTTGSLKSVRFATGSFAAVTLSHVLEHVASPADMLREIHRILRPGGTLVVMTPNARSILHRHFNRYWFQLDPPRHLLIHSPQSLRSLLEDADFEPVVRDSWRGANVTIAASRAFRAGSNYDMTVAPRRRARVVAELGQQLLALTGPLLRGRGDELVAVARRASR